MSSLFSGTMHSQTDVPKNNSQKVVGYYPSNGAQNQKLYEHTLVNGIFAGTKIFDPDGNVLHQFNVSEDSTLLIQEFNDGNLESSLEATLEGNIWHGKQSDYKRKESYVGQF